MSRDDNAIFWRMQRGEIPQARSSTTLGSRVLTVDPDAGTIEIEYTATDEFLNPAGTVQGGFLAAMLDDTMGPCIYATLEANQISPTLTMNVAYHAPAKPGAITGKAQVTHRGGTIVHVAAELFQDGKLVATGNSTCMVRRL